MSNQATDESPIRRPVATPDSRQTVESFHTAQSVVSRRTTTTNGSAPDAEALALFMVELGIEPWEEDEFAWIAEVGLLTPLPPRWASRYDADSGAIYFVDTDTQTSTWENPLAPHLERVVEAGRMHLRHPVEGIFEEQRKTIWEEHKAELDCWHGPIQDGQGNSYFVNSRDGHSSWQDPRINAQYIYDIQSSLLRHLQGILAAEEEEKMGDFAGGTPWEIEDGAQVLSLEGLPVSRNNPGSMRKVTRVNRAMQWGADHTSTLERMGSAAKFVEDARQTEEDIQRLRLIRKVEERRMRKLSRKLSKAIHETVQGEEEDQRHQLEQKVLERRRARAQGKL